MELPYVLAWRDPGSRVVLIRCETPKQAMQQARLILNREKATSGDLYLFDGTKESPLSLVMRGIEPLPRS